MKRRAMATGHGGYLKSMSMTFTMQCFTGAAITAAKKHILVLDLT